MYLKKKNYFFYLWCNNPTRSQIASLLRLLDHTPLDTHKRQKSSQRMISPSRRPLPTQHTTNTRDELPYLQQDSNIEQPQIYALDFTATGISIFFTSVYFFPTCFMVLQQLYIQRNNYNLCIFIVILLLSTYSYCSSMYS